MTGVTMNRLYWAALALGTCAMFTVLVAAGRWPFADNGNVLITDFATVWAAAVRTLAGDPALVYDHAVHEAFYAGLIERPPADGLTFGYPPTAFLIIAPLGLAGYGPALAAYLAIGLALWFAALRNIVRDWPAALAMAVAFGGASQTILLGQNGFLTAAALAGGLALLPRRPLLSGVLFGLLAVKPHMGLALAPFLLLRGDWRAILTTVATIGGMVLVSAMMWGWQIWADYADASREIAAIVTERTDTIIGGKMQSAFAVFADRAGIATALAIHGAFALLVLAMLVRIVRRRPAFAVQAAAVIAATTMLTPYSFLYDCTVMTAAAAFLLTQPLAREDRLALMVAMALPGLWFFTATPFVPLAGLIVLLLCWRQPGEAEAVRPPSSPSLPA